MDEAVLRFRVGIFVLFSFIILAVLIFLHIEGFQSQYSVYVKPDRAPGVTKNTPVRKNGLLIGRVTNVQTEDDKVSVHLRINDNEKIYENEMISFGTESILGDAVVEVITAPKEVRGELVLDGTLMENVVVKRNPLEIVDAALDLEPKIADTLAVFQEAAVSVKDTSDNISSLSAAIQSAFNDGDSEFSKLIVDARKLSTRADSALENLDRVFESLNEIVADPELKGRINKIFDDVPRFLEEIRLTFTDARTTINSYKTVSETANTNLENLEPLTAALKENGPRIVRQINESLASIDTMVEDVAKFTESIGKIGESEGSLGKFINDSELYDSILETADNIRRVSRKLEPVMNDVRTFTDAIARDPRQLGARGMTDFRPLGTGYKASTTGRDRVIRK